MSDNPRDGVAGIDRAVRDNSPRSLSPPNPNDRKPNEEIKSGELRHGTEKPIKYFEVKCPKCKEMPGFPCKFKRYNPKRGLDEDIVDFFSIHIARVILYEAYALGSVNEFGISSGQIIKYDGNVN